MIMMMPHIPQVFLTIMHFHLIPLLKRFSIKFSKTKTKVTTLANQNRRGQSNKPIRTQNKYM